MKHRRRYRRRECKHCGKAYDPDPRVGARQRFCSAPECQKARRRIAARAWRRRNRKLANDGDVARVRVWRQNHPGYWRRQRRRWLLFDFLVPVVALKKTGFWVKLTHPRSGALRILNLVQHAGRPCIVSELLNALRISIGKAPCPCYRSSRCRQCDQAGRERRSCREKPQRGRSKAQNR